jgi:hypothetical protein
MLKLLDYNFWFIVLLFIPCVVACILICPHDGPVLRGSVTQTANGKRMIADPRYFPSKCFTLDRVASSWAHATLKYTILVVTIPLHYNILFGAFSKIIRE